MVDRASRIRGLALIVMFAAACSAPAPIAGPSTGPIPSTAAAASTAPATESPGGLASGEPSPTPGSVTPRPSTPPGTPNADRPLTADELASILVAVQATADSATVVADVSVTPPQQACDDVTCPLGTIALPGLDPVPVMADADVRALHPGNTSPIAGPLALQLGSDVALLGPVTVPGAGLALPVGSIAIPGLDDPHPGAVYAIRGWLTMTDPCPTEPPVPTDNPNGPCGYSIIAKSESDTGGSGSGGIVVQPSAYAAFAPNAVTDGGPVAPRLAVYLIRQVKVPDSTCPTACYGWQLIGRLDPVQ
jgi:hypothetical protein